MVTKAKNTTAEISVKPLSMGFVKLRIIGTTALFQNCMSEKVKQGLLCGTRKKTAAEKAHIKHDPYSEFYGSAEIVPNGPTALGLRVVAVKSAMCAAAIETEGLTKTGTQRLLFMPGDHSPLYGTPQLRMDVVRCADISRTPDIRSRAFLPKWGAEIEINHVMPQLPLSAVVALLCNAGILIGVGDYRQEKGKGAFGSFRVIGPGEKDAEWEDLVKNHGRKAQLAALENPEMANDETRELYAYWETEVTRRVGETVPNANHNSNGKAESRKGRKVAA